MLKAAEIDARRLEAESKIKLEETLARRQALAERRIAQAEAQASAEVKAAAADLAAKAAEQILAARLAGQASDPLLEGAIAQLGTRLN
jgi:F-type H+-transporting ATPase subunit b